MHYDELECVAVFLFRKLAFIKFITASVIPFGLFSICPKISGMQFMSISEIKNIKRNSLKITASKAEKRYMNSWNENVKTFCLQSKYKSNNIW